MADEYFDVEFSLDYCAVHSDDVYCTIYFTLYSIHYTLYSIHI